MQTASRRTHLHVLTEEKRAHVRGRRSRVRFQELAGGYRLLVVLLAFPVLQQRLQHVQTVVDSTRAQQGSSSGTGDEGGGLKPRGHGLEKHLRRGSCEHQGG